METTSKFFKELLGCDRKLEFDYEFACDNAPFRAKTIREKAANFLEHYCAFNGISIEDASTSYAATIRRYAADIRGFIETGLYPIELKDPKPKLSRIDYDLFLILTILVTKHRCAIMEEIAELSFEGRPLVIGVGSGIELCFIKSAELGDAYDLYINPYARVAFQGWKFYEKLYRPAAEHYGVIYAIELLEHLDDPYSFLRDCESSLAANGKVIVTTATNVPQFDHTVNFASDQDFEARVGALGLRVCYKKVIPHAYARTEIGARNVFYVFEKLV